MTQPSERPDPSSTAAVIVAHEPDDGFLRRLEPAVAQVGGVVIVDNSTSAGGRERVASVARAVGADLRGEGRNVGLGAALNAGLARAGELGFRWVLCLDQDTEALPTMMKTLAAAFDDHPEPELVAVVGSRSVDDEPPAGSANRNWVARSDVMTAGSLIDVAAAKDVGSFREDFFIDYVDFEMCLRLRSRGYRVIVAVEPTMVHGAGRPRWHRILGTSVLTSHHDADRRYSMTRNRLVVWRRYVRTDPRFVLDDVIRFCKEMAKMLLVESDRLRKLRGVAHGVLDALRGRMGPLGAPRRPSERATRFRRGPDEKY
ncbi:MAG: glycosyltransferase [Actinomycetota bacterium]